jgi:hypothetical protein
MKSKKILTILVLALGLMVCPAKVSGQVPLGTAFTYQGFLTENGKIVDGTYDLQFQLFDAPADGNQVGDTIDEGNFEVEDGHIALELNFGGDVFTGDKRWLQISIRKSAVGGNYTPLVPRLELTLTPYALYALNAASAEDTNTVGGYDANSLPYVGGGGTANYIPRFEDANTVADSVIYENAAGNVGIGTTSPSEKLEVAGTVNATAFVGDGFGLTGVTITETDPTVLASVKDGISWGEVSNRPAGLDDGDDVGGADTNWTETGGNVYRTTGNVGIGTANPSAKLEVAGTVRAVNFERISGTMKWDISGHPENQTTVSWLGNSTWIVQDSLSQMRITHNNSNELYPFDEYQDGPAIAKARRWYVTITDLPENAEWPKRVISATFLGYDSAPSSVLDGSTFGEISIWEVSPTTPREIILVVDFTKARSQAHKFGIQLMITHIP